MPPKIELDTDLCILCWKCSKSCPAEILISNPKVKNRKKGFLGIITPEKCFECRACEIVCPVKAIRVFADTE
ncbi:MAG: 4Fe-4S binding protein [Candidatus Hodarchaeales archaeon]